MGYFDGLADAIFKSDSQGRAVFYPYGIMGKGYLVNEEQRQRLRKNVKLTYMIMLPLIIVNQVAFGYMANLIVLPLFYIWYFWAVRKVSRGLEKSTEKLKVAEAYTNSAKSHNLWVLIILALLTPFLIILGLAVLGTGQNELAGLFLILLFGAAEVAICYMIYTRYRDRRKKNLTAA